MYLTEWVPYHLLSFLLDGSHPVSSYLLDVYSPGPALYKLKGPAFGKHDLSNQGMKQHWKNYLKTEMTGFMWGGVWGGAIY